MFLTEQQCGLPPAPTTTIFQVTSKPLQMWSPNLGLPSLQNGDSNTLLCVRNHPVSGPPLEQHRIQANKSPEARRRPSRTHPELSRLLQTPQDSADTVSLDQIVLPASYSSLLPPQSHFGIPGLLFQSNTRHSAHFPGHPGHCSPVPWHRTLPTILCS